MNKPFQGLRTFCKTGDDITKPFAVLGLPFDTATTFRPGARFGPSAIREASMMLIDGYHSQFPVDIREWTIDLGDADIASGNTERMLQNVEFVAGNIIKNNKHPVFLGGDHSVTLGILRAINKIYDKIAVVHFDAHYDTWDANFEEPHGHGTWLYNAVEEELVDPAKVICIGIRCPADYKTRNYLNKRGGTIFTARYAQNNIQAVISNILHLVGETPVYLTFDIDALDPAYAPGTGTPEIGGLTSMWALECIESLGGLNWIGMDVVEVAPAYDHAQITSLAAATIAWTYLSMLIYKNVISTNEDEIAECEIDESDAVEDQKRFPGPTGP